MRKIFLAIALLVTNFLFAQKTIIYCGKLVDVKNLQVLTEMSIIVEGNKIVDVQKGYIQAGASDKTIDLKNKTVMPGLIDCHVHLESETSPGDFSKQFTENIR
jgi:imidazolonepropionase-like amidohydrolase